MQPTPAQLRALRRRDPRLGRVMDRVPSFPGFPDAAQHRFRSHFHFLARAILYQQISGHAARAIHRRLCALTAVRRFPSAAEFLSLPEHVVRGAGVSANKIAAMRDLAARVDDGRLRLRAIARLADDEVIEQLVQVRGIGAWTAQMFLLFRLGRLDVMPSTDLGIQEGIRRLDRRERRPKPIEVLDRAAAWRPLCSVASWVLWRLVDVRT